MPVGFTTVLEVVLVTMADSIYRRGASQTLTLSSVGAVKVGPGVAAPVRSTCVPAVCVHAYVNGFSGVL